jgi:predicted component of type VI protein secretion system
MVGSGEPAFPADPAAATLELTGRRATLGRARSAGPPDDVDLPVVDDPAVSHHQCAFVRAPDGTWSVRDTDSANGTWINDADAPLAAGDDHVLAEGDRIFVGAWTRLTVHLTTPE